MGKTVAYAPAVLAHCRGRKLRRAKEVRGQKTEIRCQRSEGERAEVGGQKKTTGWTDDKERGKRRRMLK